MRYPSGRVAAAIALVLPLMAAVPSVWAGIEEGRIKAQVCIGCHGADGNSPIPTVPSLAGQPRQFLVQALYMFREGRRVNEQMTPFVGKLSNTDLNDLAAFFGAQKMAAPQRETPQARVAQGKAITQQQNCVACHTANLTGQQQIPRLAGQHQAYLLDQLKQFRASKRADLDGTMTSAVQGLTSDDIEVLADYLSGLSVP